jgi:hypothetical protein
MKRALSLLSILGAFGMVARAGAQTEEPSEVGEQADGDAVLAPGSGDSLQTETVQACIDRRDRGQMLRIDGRWLESRAVLERCASDRCPILVRADCQAWLSELSRLIPSIVVVLDQPERGTEKAKVFIGGTPEAGQAFRTEVPIELEPGTHRLRIEMAPFVPVETTITPMPGEQKRLVRVRFAEPHRARPEATPVADTAPAIVYERPIPASTYLFAAGALAGASASAFLFVAARSDLEEARETCAPICSEDDRRSVERRLLAADIVGVAALLLGGAATYTFFDRPSVPVEVGRAALSLHGTSTGGELAVRGVF